MPHPLNGAKASVLARVLREAGPVERSKLLPIWGSAMGRGLFSLLEKIPENSLRPAEAMEPPVFLLGHWRSGTTHLYNIMSLGGFGYVPPVATGLPGELLTLGRWLRPMLEKQLPDSRYIDNIPVTPTSPQEDEIALANLSPLSFYHGIYFPSRFDWFLDRGVFLDHASSEDIAQWEEMFILFLRKLDALFGGQRLLIKNPTYTARPEQLAKLFPGAKFVHIHRDPFDVFPSMQNFYAKLFPVMALQPYDQVDADAAIFRTYDRMMRQLTEQTAEWQQPDFVEVAYADLNADPLATVERIYNALHLPGFDEARATFAAYLESIKGYEKNRFRKADQTTERIAKAWEPWLSRWGYEVPS